MTWVGVDESGVSTLRRAMDRMDRHAVSTGSQHTDFLPVGARIMPSHARQPQGQPHILRAAGAKMPSRLRYAHLPADVAAEHTGPTLQRVAAGSGSAPTPAGAGTGTMDDACLIFHVR